MINIYLYVMNDFVENEINSREMILDEYIKNSTKTNKFGIGNHSNMANMNTTFYRENMRETKQIL